jgi:hypothetical protein
MKRYILFPYSLEDDNRKGFAFAIELARWSDADIIALTSLEGGEHQTRKRKKPEFRVARKKNQIYGNLLEMKGYYHGRYNQWNAFYDIRIHSQIVKKDMSIAICALINKHPGLIIILQRKYFYGPGLCEEISSCDLKVRARFFVLPQYETFDVASPNLESVFFHKHKRLAFIKMLNETKIFDLPQDQDEFRGEMIFPQAV